MAKMGDFIAFQAAIALHTGARKRGPHRNGVSMPVSQSSEKPFAEQGNMVKPIYENLST